MDLISRQAAIEDVHSTVFDFLDICDDDSESPMTESDKRLLELNKALTTALRRQPTIDPVNHGKWESDEFLYTTGQTICSACKTGFYVNDLLNVGEGAQEFLPNYCPHCGARMDGE